MVLHTGFMYFLENISSVLHEGQHVGEVSVEDIKTMAHKLVLDGLTYDIPGIVIFVQT